MSLLNSLLGHKPHALLFDLDGTLVDSVPDLTMAVDTMLRDLGCPVAGETLVRQWVGNGAVMLVKRALAYASGGAVETVDGWQSAHQQFLQHYGDAVSTHSRLYEGVYDALQVWLEADIPMAVVTNKPRRFVPAILNHFTIEQLFAAVVGGDCLPQRKPDPAPLLHACELLAVSPGQCVMIGDSRNDVGAARAATMPVVCVSYGYNHGEPIAMAQPDLVLDSLVELL